MSKEKQEPIRNSSNTVPFTSLSEKFILPNQYRGKQSEVFGALIEYTVKHYKNTRKYKEQVVKALNILLYCIIAHEAPPFDWKSSDPFETMPNYPDELVEGTVGIFLLSVDAIEWDVTPVDTDYNFLDQASKESEIESGTPVEATTFENLVAPAIEPVVEPVVEEPKQESTFIPAPAPNYHTMQSIISGSYNDTLQKVPTAINYNETPKEDLYIQPPKYPQFDFNKPWLSMEDKGDQLVIYTTLPEIPTKQNEISVTTDPNRMTDSEFMNLYPKQFIRTRSPIMYEKQKGMDFDEELGCILPIKGFTKKEVLNNIIQYPHFYKLKRIVDGEIVSMYEDIEVDGELWSVKSVWDSLPESLKIPKQSDFIKEYVVRRYLLEESKGIKHKYPMYGTLQPFLTLFMPADMYIKRGYKDTLQIAKQCVNSRVSFKRSRNPILKRVNLNV